MTVLAVEGLVAGYDPDLPIVRGAGFAVAAGETLAVLGPNGAGKSTLIRAVMGLVPVRAGRVLLDGSEITGARPEALVRRGLGFVPQTENVFTRLTVRENLLVAAELLPRERRPARLAAMEGMFPDLAAAAGAPAGSLSGGQRQMLAAARALLTEPRVLILDETSAGLSPKLVARVFATLGRIAASGVTLVLVEQNVRAALALAPRALVLVDGEVAFDGASAELGGDRLGALFLGGRRAAAGAAP